MLGRRAQRLAPARGSRTASPATAARARPLRAAFKSFTGHGSRRAGLLGVRAHLVRARADRQPDGGGGGDAPRARVLPGAGRAVGVGALPSSASSSSAPATPAPPVRQYRAALLELPDYAAGARRARPRRGRARPPAARRSALRRAPSSTVPLPQFVTTLADLLQSSGHMAERPPAVRARRRRRAAAARQRRQERPRDRPVLRRPRPSGCPTRSSSRGARTRRAAEHRRRRRARLGVRPQRPLRRGPALGEALAAARHPRRDDVLPPRAWPSAAPAIRRPRAPGSTARSRSIRTSRRSGAPSPGGLREAGCSPRGRRRRARAARRRRRAPARELHHQPLHAHRGRRRPRLRHLRPRPGRDPDLPGARHGHAARRGRLRARRLPADVRAAADADGRRAAASRSGASTT